MKFRICLKRKGTEDSNNKEAVERATMVQLTGKDVYKRQGNKVITDVRTIFGDPLSRNRFFFVANVVDICSSVRSVSYTHLMRKW